MTPAHRRRLAVAAAAAPFGGVLSRRLMFDLGADSHVIRREVDADRWALHGRRTVAVHTAPLGELADQWRALWEVGCGTTLDGVTSLQAVGLKGFAAPVLHVSVPRDTHPVAVPGVRIHRVQRLPGETVEAGRPRSRPAVAAMRAAYWAGSDRQAALLLVLPVQQRLVSPESLTLAESRVSGRRRRGLVRQLVRDVTDGSQSLGELDIVAALRRRRLPTPDRQVVVQTSRGRVYLDVRWSSIGLVVEIDGAGHRWGLAPGHDALRQNAVTLGGDIVLRIDLIEWRLDPDAYLDQICEAHAMLTARRAA